MDEAGGVDRGQGLGRLAEQPQAVSLQAAVAADEQGIHVRAVQILHDKVLRAVGRQPVLVGLDDPRMLQLHRDLAFGGFFPRKRASKAAVFSMSRIFSPTILSLRRSRAM